ncbi:MAG: SIMPL domain-containing protein [Dehalococcoidia bacterium]|nr:SIMPL domain-containing protein [Dehalococcoidia bacterium]
MKKVTHLLLAVLVLGALSFSAWGCGAATAANDNPGSVYVVGQNTGISVSGVGTVVVVRDLAILNIGVQTQSSTVAEAQQEAAVAMTEVMAALKASGVADKDITTSGYSVYPVYNYMSDAAIIIGYTVSNSITVKIRHIEDAGNIIDEAALAGGDALRINNIYFTVDNPEQYNDIARERAMADALTRAGQLAKLGGVELGKPAYITESGGYSSLPPVVYYETATVSGGAGDRYTTPISSGESELTVYVQVVYNIQ